MRLDEIIETVVNMKGDIPLLKMRSCQYLRPTNYAACIHTAFLKCSHMQELDVFNFDVYVRLGCY